MKKTKGFILVLILGLALQLGFAQSTKAAEDEIVVFEDENLENAIFEALGYPESITQSDLESLEYLSIYGNKITSLEGLQNAKNLTSLMIYQSAITDFTPISELTKLQSISLNNIGETKNPNIIETFAKLTNLTSIDLSGFGIKDVTPYANLKNVTMLTLRDNSITDISPLKGLTNLTWLDVSGNNISDISKLPNVSILSLDNNQITTINPLFDLPAIETLSLLGNPFILSKGSSAYEGIQKLLKNGVNVVLNPEDVFKLRTKNVTDNSITIEWSILENTTQMADMGFTVSLDGKQVKVIEDKTVREYTFTNLTKGKEYEVSVEFGFNYGQYGGPETATLKVKAEGPKTTVVKPVVSGNKATISNENIRAAGFNGQLVIDVKDLNDKQVHVALTKDQIQMLQDNNIKVEVARADVSVQIPASVLGNGEDVNLVVERLEKADGAVGATYDFTIETASGNISQFAVPVTLTFQVDKAGVKDAKVWYYNPTTKEWEKIGGTFANGVVTAETTHFSTYTVFEEEVSSEPVTSGNDESEKSSETSPEQELGPRLPDTATNTMNFLIFGGLLLLLAAGILFYQMRKERV
ncbi:leucine-rich repeat domain-containing protein [Robertmurraya massiliosenegalensis]|uniref:leucine-rich repeat domain-containing protein n=1 Tax=Robertmurraya TaxID=2837507 RepID=UPI0039A71141